MRTLHRYLLRQIVASLAMTVVVFTFVLLLVIVLREVLPLLMTGKGSFVLVAKALLLALPWLLSFALPMAILTATLLVFGRFSADQELTAARASGISLAALITPILILSLGLCGLTAWINLEVAPRCRVAFNDLRFDLKAALMNVDLPEGRFIEDFPGYIIYVGKNRKGNLQDILLHRFADGKTNTEMTVHAPTGRVENDIPNQRITLHLYDVSGMWSTRDQTFSMDEFPIEIPLKGADKKAIRKPDISDMTWFELQAELRQLERRISQPLKQERTMPDEDRREQKRVRPKQVSDITAPIRFEIHKKFALSFACFGFMLIGIPLGIRVQRRETNINIFVTLGLLFVYYVLLNIAQALTSHPEYAPHLLIWLPNFLFQAVGAVLLWRANRGI